MSFLTQSELDLTRTALADAIASSEQTAAWENDERGFEMYLPEAVTLSLRLELDAAATWWAGGDGRPHTASTSVLIDGVSPLGPGLRQWRTALAGLFGGRDHLVEALTTHAVDLGTALGVTLVDGPVITTFADERVGLVQFTFTDRPN